MALATQAAASGSSLVAANQLPMQQIAKLLPRELPREEKDQSKANLCTEVTTGRVKEALRQLSQLGGLLPFLFILRCPPVFTPTGDE